MMKSLMGVSPHFVFFDFATKHLNHDPPNGLHRHCDEADDRVGKSEVENQEVNICATLHLVPAIYYITFDRCISYYVFNVMRMVNNVCILKFRDLFIFRRVTFVIVFPQWPARCCSTEFRLQMKLMCHKYAELHHSRPDKTKLRVNKITWKISIPFMV